MYKNSSQFGRLSLVVSVLLSVIVTGAIASPLSATPPAPENDNIADAVLLDRDAVTKSVIASNVGATLEDGESSIKEESSTSWGASIWYKMTPTVSGFIEMDTTDSDFDTVLGVYTFTQATTFAGATEIANNDDSGNGVQSSISFNAISGTTYYIVVGGYDVRTGTITLNWNIPTLPTNDNIADATVLTATGQQVFNFNNYGTTVEADENQVIMSTNQFDNWENSIWFKASPATGIWGVELATSLGANLVVLNSQTFAEENVQQRSSNGISFNATSGTTYYIGIAGRHQNFTMTFRSAVRPNVVEDVAINRGPVTTVTWTAPDNFIPTRHQYVVHLFNEDNFRSCTSYGDTSCSFPRIPNGIWTVDVYAGDLAINLESVHYVEESVVILNTSNDYFASAVSLLVDNGEVDDFLDYSTLENNEPLHNTPQTFSSVWYTYAPTTTGTSTFSVAETDFENSDDIQPIVAVYTGDQLTNLQRVATSARSVSWESRASQSYYIAVSSLENYADSGWENQLFNFRLTWSHVAAPPPAVVTPDTTTVSAPKTKTVKAKNKATMTSILKKAKIKVPKNATATYRIAKASKKNCSITSGRIQLKKKITCELTVKIKPKKGKTVSHRVNVRS